MVLSKESKSSVNSAVLISLNAANAIPLSPPQVALIFSFYIFLIARLNGFHRLPFHWCWVEYLRTVEMTWSEDPERSQGLENFTRSSNKHKESMEHENTLFECSVNGHLVVRILFFWVFGSNQLPLCQTECFFCYAWTPVCGVFLWGFLWKIWHTLQWSSTVRERCSPTPDWTQSQQLSLSRNALHSVHIRPKYEQVQWINQTYIERIHTQDCPLMLNLFSGCLSIKAALGSSPVFPLAGIPYFSEI